MRRTWCWVTLGVVLATGAAAGGSLRWRALRARDRAVAEGLERAREERSAGRPDLAAARLASLEAGAPGREDVVFEQGLCELARGRVDLALALFRRIPQDSARLNPVAVPRAQGEIGRGRLARAEDILARALGPTSAGTERREARDALVRLLRSEGRFVEARRVFLEGFTEWPDAVAFLRSLYRLDADPYPVEGVRAYLDRATRQTPDDDRVWLGRAHLLARLGRLDEAGKWLDACLERRPADPAVWRARLEWARSARRADIVRAALSRLPADPIEAEDLRGWLAARVGDTAREKAALERLAALDPGLVEPLDRLAELALADGKPDVARRLRARQAEINRAREAYLARLSAKDPRAVAPELARLAARLGLRFESEHWAQLGGQTPPELPELPRLARGATLGDLLNDVGPPQLAQAADHRARAAAGGTIRFVDDARRVGLAFSQESGSNGVREKLTPPVTFSGGVGLIDYDGDGWLDVYCVQGGPTPPGQPPSATCHDRLFRNRGDGTFEDVSERAGIAAMAGGYGHGVTVGDIDNDGHPDLFVTRWRSYSLYRNRGDGTFEDVTARWGLAGDRDWPTSAALADLDGDGDLDLYVCHYLKWDEADNARLCADPDDPSRYHCNPRDFPSQPDHLFRNDGGRFTDISAEAGITAVDTNGRGLGVVAVDLDGDGRLDLFVANDMSAYFFWHNLGGMRFEEIALEAGVGGNASGGYQAGMGVACGDIDGDGQPDLAITNFYNESTAFFRNLGGGRFADHTSAIGLAAPSHYLLGFGIQALDVDNDGHLDLLTANGHIHDGRPQYPWKMPAQLLAGGPGGQLTDVSEKAGPPFSELHIGRGLAAADLDNDGRVDALLVAQDEPLVYLHNQTPEIARSLTLRLEGLPPGSNRDAVGAVVTIEAGGRRQTAWRIGGGSYLSAADPRVRFGLAGARQVEHVEVRWPSGRRSSYANLAPGGYHLRENSTQLTPLPGFHFTPQSAPTSPRTSEERQARP